MSILIFGSINVDHVMQVERISRPGETNKAHEISQFFGGKGANQAIAAARVSTNVPVIIAGAVANDKAAIEVKENFVANKVNIDHIHSVEAPTGSAYIFIDPDAQNAITIVAGANNHVDEQLITGCILNETSHLVFQMEVPLDQMLKLAKRYKHINPNGTILFNTAPAPTLEQKSKTIELLNLVDILIVNEHEATAILNLMGYEQNSNEEKSVTILSHQFNTTTIITLGDKGAIAAINDKIIVTPTIKVKALDTTGAGDTFVGVLATKLAHGIGLETSLRFACKAGALSCLKLGAQQAMPTASELTLGEPK